MERLDVLIADGPAVEAVRENAAWPFKVRRVPATDLAAGPLSADPDDPATMNQLWPMAQAEHVVFMDERVQIESADWLDALMTFATVEDIGAVGGGLPSGDESVHAPGDLGGVAALCWSGSPTPSSSGDWALVQRACSIVSGPVLATRVSVLSALNGFDVQFSSAYARSDFSLRLGAMGYRVIHAPDCLVRQSRPPATAPPRGSETARFLRRWSTTVSKGSMPHRDDGSANAAVQTKPPCAWWESIGS